MTNRQTIFGLVVLCLLLIGLVYINRDYFYVQYDKAALNHEFVCPENQTSYESNAYLYNYIEFYKVHYPAMRISELLTMRYQQLVDHNCTKTLENIANGETSTSSPDSYDPTLKEMGQPTAI